jgi:hypothetical protein
VTLATGKAALLLFDGVQGQLLTIGVSGNSVSSLSINVYSPDGSSLTNASFGTAGGGLQLPKLQKSGTYMVQVYAATGSGSATVAVYGPQTGSLSLGGSALNLSVSPPGRRAVVSFSGTAGQAIDLTASGVTITSSRLSILDLSGREVIAATIGTAGGQLRPTLPSTGAYNVLVDPVGSVAGAMTLVLTTTPASSLTVNGASSNFTTPAAGQPAIVTFTGSAGQYVNVAISEPCNAAPITATITVVRPDGVQLTSTSLSTLTSLGCTTTGAKQGNINVPLSNLPQSGTYTLKILPPSGKTGTFAVGITDNMGAAVSINSQTTYTTAYNGQGLQLTFNGQAGQYLSVGVYHSCTIDAGYVATVLKPDGTTLQEKLTPTLSSTGCTSTSYQYATANLNLPVLPQTGTYTVLVRPTKVVRLTLTVSVTSGIPAAVSVNSQANYTGAYNGQGVQLTFSGNTGQFISVGVYHSCSAGYGYAATVIMPNGTALLSTSSPTLSTAGCANSAQRYATSNLNLPALPMTGTYTILVQPLNAQRLTFTVAVTNGIAGALAINSQSTYSNLYNGQGAQLTFNGTAGQYLTVGAFHPCTIDFGLVATVVKPDGSILQSNSSPALSTAGCTSSYYSYATTNLNLPALPVSGTYTVLVQPTKAVRVSFTVSLASGISASIAVNSQASYTSAYNGQGVQLTFSGSTGQYLSVGVYHPCHIDHGFSATVVNPDGTVLQSTSAPTLSSVGCSSTSYSYATTNLNLPALPTTGSYTILVQPTKAAKHTFTVSLTSGKSGIVAINSQTSYTSSFNGQGVQLTFSGTAGQYVNVGAYHSCAVNSGFQAKILNPDGTILFTAPSPTLVTTGCSNSSQMNATLNANLPALPVTGTYTILIQPTKAALIPFTVYVGGTVTGTLAINGSSVASALTTGGQGAQLTFSGTAAQNLALSVVSACSSIKGAVVYILKPDNTQLSTGTVPSSACTGGYTGTLNINIPTLPATGNYTVLIRQTVIGTGTVTSTLRTR